MEERNGKGKEYYYNGNLEYEGEYKNGIKNGKGKEYDIENHLIFEGEYLNGKRYGKGKEYDENGNLIYDGEYLYRERKDINKNEYGNFIKRGIRGRGRYRYRGRGYRFPLYENEILNELKEGKKYINSENYYMKEIKYYNYLLYTFVK